jgi:hypothetical protein
VFCTTLYVLKATTKLYEHFWLVSDIGIMKTLLSALLAI